MRRSPRTMPPPSLTSLKMFSRTTEPKGAAAACCNKWRTLHGPTRHSRTLFDPKTKLTGARARIGACAAVVVSLRSRLASRTDGGPSASRVVCGSGRGRTPPREAAFNHEAAPRFRVRARHEPARMEAMARVVFDWSHKNRFVLALADKSHICRGVPRTAADDAARLRSRLT